jgi:hypothetical protein
VKYANFSYRSDGLFTTVFVSAYRPVLPLRDMWLVAMNGDYSEQSLAVPFTRAVPSYSSGARLFHPITTCKKLISEAWVRERTIPTERPLLVGDVTTNFCGYRVARGQCDESPYCCILGSLDRAATFSFKWLLNCTHRGWVDPVPDPLLLRKCDSAGNRTRTSGSVARNSR